MSAHAAEYIAWAQGRRPNHLPSRADLLLNSVGVGAVEPVVVVGVPARQ